MIRMLSMEDSILKNIDRKKKKKFKHKLSKIRPCTDDRCIHVIALTQLT